MGYQLIYDNPKPQRRRKGLRLIPFTAAAFLAFWALVNLCWPRGQEVLRQLILPQAIESVLAAFDGFAENLHAGESFPDALEVFMDEIYH